MRIILVGQAAFGKDCLEALLEQGENVVGVVTIPDEPGDKRPNPVKELAVEKNIPVLQPEGRSPHRLKHPSVLPWLKDLKPDLLALVFVTDFMPYEAIKLATLGGINYHPSLLPKYRGGSAINWAVIGGEKETGVTIHFIDEGVDTGDIILQEQVTVEANDSVGSVYFKKLYPLGIRLVKDAVRLIREGKAPRTPQDHSQSSFQPVITENDVRINWEKPAWEIHNLIRGANPAPGAYTTLRGEKIKLWESEIQEANPGTPGEILSIIEGAGFQVATGDGALLITRVQKAGEGKTPAAEFITSAKLQPGEKLS
jgi:methionyl-tRNA formyltransferase